MQGYSLRPAQSVGEALDSLAWSKTTAVAGPSDDRATTACRIPGLQNPNRLVQLSSAIKETLDRGLA